MPRNSITPDKSERTPPSTPPRSTILANPTLPPLPNSSNTPTTITPATTALLEELSGTSQNVMVVVRIRPLNKRETQEYKSLNCITIQSDHELSIYKDSEPKNDPLTRDKQNKKQFTFDYVFGEGSTQEQVYTQTGSILLKKCITGLNGCVFAYGQTGSGKTYTMEGMESDPGIMKRLSQDLFDHIATISDKIDVTIKATYLEIYQEKVIDLMAQKQGLSGRGNLQIREDKLRGIFVENLCETPVSSFEEINQIITDCTQYRTKGETKMNAVSSRSHAVLTLLMEQRERDDDIGYTYKFSKINLIDLAGSERADATGAVGERLKEGAKINQSLSCLGQVINALCQQRPHVPYRDSKLTRLLQDSLGGNSVTLMIVALSPASVNFEESLSSLQFADRAKQIKNKVHINRDPKLQRIAELMEENKKLKEKIAELEAIVAGRLGCTPMKSPSKGRKSMGVGEQVDYDGETKGCCCIVQ